MPLYLYDTLTRQKRLFTPLHDDFVRMYSCGPTVYDYAQIGNARTYVFSDMLRKTLIYNGYKVQQVMNITDVGHLTEADISDEGQDKIEMTAKKEKKTVWDVAQFYTDDFFKMMNDLNILRPSIVCKATDHIKEQIDLIQKIQKNGYTYVIDRGVCFDTSKFPCYADFAQLDLEGMKKGARIEFDPQKKNPTDFWLWRFSDPKEKRQMEWNSPWGRGFPGWHIECSAMSMKYLGEHFDIHTGGVDHIPVHHTNEIAQNWAATGHKVVNFWLHGEFLLVEGKKMSKSLKNFYRVEDIKKRGFNPLALRYLFLTTHYRSSLNFTWDGLQASQNALEKIREFLRRVITERSFHYSDDTFEINNEFSRKFLKALNDDLNMPQVLAVVWNLIKSNLDNKEKAAILLKFDQVLGLNLKEVFGKEEKIPDEIKKLVDEREKARENKNWDEADKLRETIQNLGYQVEDAPSGPKLIPRF